MQFINLLGRNNAVIIQSFVIMGVGLIVLGYGIIGDHAAFANSGVMLLAIGAIVSVFGKRALKKYA
ncbi:MAG TPA: hypothetical protein VFS46_03090 [Nitrososphaera sp.]|nr:hypothetical protein [Nitrososphaera sp.]